jgi:mycofactocin glycosyltransferase
MRLVLDQGVRRAATTLTGGSPRRVLQMNAAGWQALRALERGDATSPAAQALARRLLDAGIAHPRPRSRATLGNVTVVIPTRDRPEQLDRCLGALDRGVEAIVVDDGSGDRAALARVTARHGARRVCRDAPGGPAAARNVALAAVKSELVAFVDSDCFPAGVWLRALAGHFEDPLVGAVAPRVRPLAGKHKSALQRYLEFRSPLDMGPKEAGVQPGGPVPYVPAAALLVRRCALGGGFDTDLRYGEDVDLVWRLLDAGWRVRYDPRVAVGHQEPDTLRQVLARRFRYGSSAAQLARRHPDRLAPVALRPWPTLVATLMLCRRPLPAAIVAYQQSTVLADRVRRLGLARAWGVRWFAEATYGSILSLARYGGTFALPVALAYALRKRRPVVLALLVLPAIEDRRRRAASLDPLRWVALALLDDGAYGAGVWWGCIRTGDFRALIPSVRRRPKGRRLPTITSSVRRRSAARDL